MGTRHPGTRHHASAEGTRPTPTALPDARRPAPLGQVDAGATAPPTSDPAHAHHLPPGASLTSRAPATAPGDGLQPAAAGSGAPGSAGGPVLAGITDEAAPDLPGQLAVLAELGWSAIELRSVDTVPVAALSDRRFTEVAKTLSDHGVRAVCLASGIGGWARPVSTPFEHDLAEFDTLARRCGELGTRYIRIMSYPNSGLPETRWRDRVVARIGVLAEAAETAGVVLLHENCSGWAGTSAERALELLDAVRSPALKLLFDTGNGVAHGYDGLALLEKVLPHVVHVHVKDAVGGRFVAPGQGAARVADCVKLLRDNGYQGTWSLEPHVSLVPHQAGALAAGAPAAFVAAGRAMARLLR
ncbi:sugar phosphate isomerase/epimerase family protein [Actinosynnema sp. NPDC047251]|uniref:sugar phosphate isomerase/epimerase family protein n=1 Tax=Saccharothrix espanaensis TaxID=103731 RepID=UPI001E48412A|nr:sugar phosphate isomerase/epimerase family protein [Saccharothrix espanaensis]